MQIFIVGLKDFGDIHDLQVLIMFGGLAGSILSSVTLSQREDLHFPVRLARWLLAGLSYWFATILLLICLGLPNCSERNSIAVLAFFLIFTTSVVVCLFALAHFGRPRAMILPLISHWGRRRFLAAQDRFKTAFRRCSKRFRRMIGRENG